MNGLNKHCSICVCLLLYLLCSFRAAAQHKLDSLSLDSIKIFPRSKFISRWVQKGMDAITKDDPDTSEQAAFLKVHSENAFKKYNGRIIRRITVNRVGFEQTVTDTAKKLASLGARLMNRTHINTKEWVIRDNLFIREGKPLDAFKVADNERYLRTLNFIQDARILVKRVPGSADSVDLEVVTRDVYTLSGGLDIGSLQHFKADVSEANLFGMGQKLKYTALLHQDRDPNFGYQVAYTKNSIGGSFTNLSAGYGTANPSLYDGQLEEHGYFISLDRPLPSSYAKFAGGATYAYRYTEYAYKNNRPDSLFYKYGMHAYDVWAGYNITDRRTMNKGTRRNRKFISLRYARNVFYDVPYQVGDRFDPLFNNMQAILGQVTFFRQDFYKMNYVYGFGITEDIPYGYNLSLVGGWHRQLDLDRPYGGIKFDRYVVPKTGEFYRFYFRGGAFYNKYELQDAEILVGINMFSRLWQWKQTKARQYMRLSYAGIFNRKTSELLRVNNPFGLQSFSDGTIRGDQRLNYLSETYVYLPRKILGFSFAPFVLLNAVALVPEKEPFKKSDIFTGIGGGIRSRNENLVFGTIELRGIYFPRKVEGQPAFKILFNANLRYRYNSNYISKPDIPMLNTDDAD